MQGAFCPAPVLGIPVRFITGDSPMLQEMESQACASPGSCTPVAAPALQAHLELPEVPRVNPILFPSCACPVPPNYSQKSGQGSVRCLCTLF